jgi:hypothetical protein
MADEKDRYGDKMHDREKAHEDQWARDQDQRLLEKLRQKPPVEMLCPQCHSQLVASAGAPFAMLGCPNAHGAWLDHQTLEALLKRLQ